MTLLFVLIGWVVLCGLAAGIASGKGRDGFGYFMLALVLSPLVGIIAALVAKPDEAKVAKTRLESGTERKCPFCAEIVKVEAVVCRFCSRDLPDEQVQRKADLERMALQQAAADEVARAAWVRAEEAAKAEREQEAAYHATPEYKRNRRISVYAVLAITLFMVLVVTGAFDHSFRPDLQPVKTAGLAQKAQAAAQKAAEAAQRDAELAAKKARYAELTAELVVLSKQYAAFTSQWKAGNHQGLAAFVAVARRFLAVGAEANEIAQATQDPVQAANVNLAWKELQPGMVGFIELATSEGITAEVAREASVKIDIHMTRTPTTQDGKQQKSGLSRPPLQPGQVVIVR